jgi:hypothetical protein
LAGIILHGPMSLTVDCAIRDLSDGGARVRLPAFMLLGPPLALIAPSLERAYEAVIAWQDGKDLGLTFVQPIDLEAPHSDLARLARLLWLERRAR